MIRLLLAVVLSLSLCSVSSAQCSGKACLLKVVSKKVTVEKHKEVKVEVSRKRVVRRHWHVRHRWFVR